MRTKRTALALSIVAALILMAGCAKQVKAPVPGAINTFDSDTYTALSVAQASINSIKNDPDFPAVVAKYPVVKTILNQCIADYNQANALFQAWKASNGTQPTAPVQAAMTTLNTDVTKLQTTASGGGK